MWDSLLTADTVCESCFCKRVDKILIFEHYTDSCVISFLSFTELTNED